MTALLSKLLTDTDKNQNGKRNNNGTEIYEGDIIRRKSNFLIDQGFCNEVVEFRNGIFEVNYSPLTNIARRFEPEVIGNIFENPELLRDTQ